MTTTPSPTWYDVLGVSRDATPEEIKAAWRHATDKFEPGSGSGQFRMFNEAADVLLDPARRAEYDATLARPTSAEPIQHEAPAVAAPGPETATTEVPPPPAEDLPPATDAEPAAPTSRRARVLVGVLAALAVLALATAGWFALQVRNDARAADARSESPAAAERAAKALFAYDYRHLPADRERAANYVTDSFGKKYLKSFTALEKQKDGTAGLAVQSKTVVTASVLGSGVVDADDDGTARVLVYVNQVASKAGKDPQIFQNRVAMTMKRDGNRWLVDDVKSY